MTINEKYFNVNSEGFSVCCKLYSANAKCIEKLVIFCHGFGGHKENRAAARFAKRVISKNREVAVLTFDWPCHGEDVRKTLRLEECGKYLGIVITHARTAFSPSLLFAYATSFGGYLTLKYISENGSPFEKIALRCPAVPMFGVLTKTIMGDSELKTLEKGKPVLIGFDRKVKTDKVFVERLKQADIADRDFSAYASDIMILHGTKDEIVPVEAVRSFAEKNSIFFEAVDGADHRFSDPAKMDYAIELITEWFDLK